MGMLDRIKQWIGLNKPSTPAGPPPFTGQSKVELTHLNGKKPRKHETPKPE